MKDIEISQPQTKFKILLIGDSCLDEYIYGSTERLSPEAPVMVLKQLEKEMLPGMASNVKLNLENLGCEVDFITNLETIVKTRFVDKKSGYHLLRVDNESDVVPWSGKMPYEIIHYDAVVISDYGKGFVSYDHIQGLRKDFQGPIFLDTKKTNLELFQGIFVKINESEYKRATSINDHLIVTLGKAGAMYKTSSTEDRFDAPEVEVFDVCGAGDTFLAALVYRYLESQSMAESIMFANRAASITVQHRGVYAPRSEEMQ